jgi:hypothetical protein
MSQSNGLGTLLTLGAVGVGGYFLYEWLTTPAAAAATPATSAAPLPSSTSPVVSSTVTTGGAVTPPAPVVVEPPPAQVQPSGPSLASIFSNILAGASTDTNFTGAGNALSASPYHWNVYLQSALPAGDSIPDLGTVFPGVDLTQPMSATTYWAGMGPALTKAYGLSGFFAGLGALQRFGRIQGLGQDDGTGDGSNSTVIAPPGFVGPIQGASNVEYPASQQQLAALASQVQAGGTSNTTLWLAIAAAAGIGLIALAGK